MGSQINLFTMFFNFFSFGKATLQSQLSVRLSNHWQNPFLLLPTFCDPLSFSACSFRKTVKTWWKSKKNRSIYLFEIGKYFCHWKIFRLHLVHARQQKKMVVPFLFLGFWAYKFVKKLSHKGKGAIFERWYVPIPNT